MATTPTSAEAEAPKTTLTRKPRAARPVAAARKRTRTVAAHTKLKPSAPTARPTLKQVATKSRKKVNTVVHLTRDASLKLIDSQRAIWLAGLGALAKVTTTTGTRGEQAFEALIKAGEKLESQARGAIDTNADLLKNKITDASNVVDQGIDTVGDAFDARVKQALARLGYPKPRASAK
ncbi:MAG: phasin family protein [Rhodoferax sp.]|nr:phasin family protein [Rhodoferax sp.]